MTSCTIFIQPSTQIFHAYFLSRKFWIKITAFLNLHCCFRALQAGVATARWPIYCADNSFFRSPSPSASPGDDVLCCRMASKLWSSTTCARWSCSHCPQYSPAPHPAPGCLGQCFRIRKGVARSCLQNHDVIMMLVVMVSITLAWWWWCWKYLMWWWCCRWWCCFPSSCWCVEAGADDGDVGTIRGSLSSALIPRDLLLLVTMVAVHILFQVSLILLNEVFTFWTSLVVFFY